MGKTSLRKETLKFLEGNFQDDNLNVVIEAQKLFCGLQKWDLTNSDTEKVDNMKNSSDISEKDISNFVQPHVMITKIELDSFKIFMKLHSEIHPIITSVNTGRFLEFYLWNKRKSLQESNLENNQKLIVTEKQKINLNIDHLNI